MRIKKEKVADVKLAKELGVNIQPNPGERFLSPNEVGKILNVTGEAVKQWIFNRKLPATKLVNGYWRIRVSELEKFLKCRHDVRLHALLDLESASLQPLLEQLNLSVIQTNNTADALIKAADRPPSFTILSAKNPDIWKLVKRFRETKSLRRLPVFILVDGVVSDNTTNLALHHSVQGFLTEPVEKQTLEKEINRVFNRN